jgi:hypothetical protein
MAKPHGRRLRPVRCSTPTEGVEFVFRPGRVRCCVFHPGGVRCCSRAVQTPGRQRLVVPKPGQGDVCFPTEEHAAPRGLIQIGCDRSVGCHPRL